MGIQGHPISDEDFDYDYDHNFFRGLSASQSSNRAKEHTLEVNRKYMKDAIRETTDKNGGRNVVKQTVTENSLYYEEGRD